MGMFKVYSTLCMLGNVSCYECQTVRIQFVSLDLGTNCFRDKLCNIC